MSSLGTGLLAAFGGSAEGLGGAMKKQAESERNNAAEALKAKALEEKDKNLAILQNQFAQQRQDSQNAFVVGQTGAGRFQDGREITNSEYAGMNEADRRSLMTKAEYDQSVIDRNTAQGKELASYNNALAKDLASYQAGLQTISPTDIEQKYNFLAKTLGEEKAKEVIIASLVNKNGKDTSLDVRKLWNKVYNDKLKILSEDVTDERTSKEKEADARATADQVSGISLGGDNSGTQDGGLFDKYYGRSGVKTAGNAEIPQKNKTEPTTSNNSGSGKGLLSMGQSPQPKQADISNSDRFKSSMNSIAESYGMNTSPEVQKAIRLTQGQYNPQDGSIRFKPKDQSELKSVLVDLNSQGIQFDAAQSANGEIVLKIFEKNNLVK